MNEQVAAQPLTDEDRHEQVKYAQECVKRRPGKFDECFDCSTILQWDATLRAVETKLVKAKKWQTKIEDERALTTEEREAAIHWVCEVARGPQSDYAGGLILMYENHLEANEEKLSAVEKERDALKEELEEVSADRDSWRSVTRYD